MLRIQRFLHYALRAPVEMTDGDALRASVEMTNVDALCALVEMDLKFPEAISLMEKFIQ